MYFKDIVLDRMVTDNSLWYKITCSIRRQSHSPSFRVALTYSEYKKIFNDLPTTEIKRNGDYCYKVKQSSPLFKVLDEIFVSRNKSDSYQDTRTSKVVHIVNKGDNEK